MLTEDLGPAVFNRAPSRDDGRPVGLIRLMFRPAGLFAMALFALLIVLSVKLWREGVFESFRVKHASKVQVGDKSWMLGDRLPPPPPEKAGDLVEPLLKPNAVQADTASDESDTPEDSAE